MSDPTPKITVYTTPLCGYCTAAKRLLERKGLAFEEVDVFQEPEQRTAMIERSGRRTVPQIFIGERHIGGFDELSALERLGELDLLLEADMEPAK